MQKELRNEAVGNANLKDNRFTGHDEQSSSYVS